ncbi:CapA family protein [Desulfobacula sp.]|uniref:CapA family protein n=1 Tax=Desulfobacula sp. TaxID=2593537 RepID=UPI0025C2D69C|nr:CapA family protein [Desulfobacula sp.]MBC2704228.1 CapA family protein [Desulfobacula sp.]
MKILICGDYIVYNTPKVNTKEIFGDFIDVIQNSDISIYNQEHPVSNSNEIYSTKKFSTTDGCAPAALNPIIEAGFNYVSLSNNHIFNKGISGLKDTITFFKERGIVSFGAGKNLEEAKKILYIERDNIKLAFLNFAENEYNTATEKHGGTNPLDIISNVRQIKEAREKANFVFVIIHGGLEYCHAPTPRMVSQFRFYAENGASAIICHHSHVVSGYEVYNGCPIFYGIGNFIPAKPVKQFLSNPSARQSFPVQFEITDKKLDFTGYPLEFNLKESKLEFLQGDKLFEFHEMQKQVSDLFDNPNKIKEYIVNYFLGNLEKKSYYFNLFTRSNYFLFKVFRKINFLKFYLNYMEWKMRLNVKNTMSWNLHRCETHKDVLDIIYEFFIDTYVNK